MARVDMAIGMLMEFRDVDPSKAMAHLIAAAHCAETSVETVAAVLVGFYDEPL